MRCAYRLSLLCHSSRQARVDFETARTILLTDGRFSGVAGLARLERPEIFHVGAQRNAAVAIAASASRLSISYWQALSRRSEARLRKVAAPPPYGAN
jgi:Mg-chelatase subunit ChlD